MKHNLKVGDKFKATQKGTHAGYIARCWPFKAERITDGWVAATDADGGKWIFNWGDWEIERIGK
jgi:hypothetical protein